MFHVVYTHDSVFCSIHFSYRAVLKMLLSMLIHALAAQRAMTS